MPMKEEIVKAVRDGRIIAIIRGFAPDVCLNLAEAYFKGGIRLVEVTFNQKAPETWKDTAAAIGAIKTRFAGDVHVGAGTVLTEEQLSMYAMYMERLGNRPDLFSESAYVEIYYNAEYEDYDIPPEALEDERFTTMQARETQIAGGVKRGDRKKTIDSIAASYILEGYLLRMQKRAREEAEKRRMETENSEGAEDGQ